MLAPGGPVTPGYVVRRRRAAWPSADADEVSVLLNGQWPGPSRVPVTGMPALAHAVLANACLDAGLARRRGPVPPRDRRSAARYLLEADPDVPLSLEAACALADLDADRVRAIARLRLP
jgi:hypothetical protein